MTHALLTGEQDPPGEWTDGWISGKSISFKRREDAEHFHYVVITQGGERGDGVESRPVEVWSATVPERRIVSNWRGEGNTVGEGVGMSEGAAIALEYMEDN